MNDQVVQESVPQQEGLEEYLKRKQAEAEKQAEQKR